MVKTMQGFPALVGGTPSARGGLVESPWLERVWLGDMVGIYRRMDGFRDARFVCGRSLDTTCFFGDILW